MRAHKVLDVYDMLEVFTKQFIINKLKRNGVPLRQIMHTPEIEEALVAKYKKYLARMEELEDYEYIKNVVLAKYIFSLVIRNPSYETQHKIIYKIYDSHLKKLYVD